MVVGPFSQNGSLIHQIFADLVPIKKVFPSAMAKQPIFSQPKTASNGRRLWDKLHRANPFFGSTTKGSTTQQRGRAFFSAGSADQSDRTARYISPMR